MSIRTSWRALQTQISRSHPESASGSVGLGRDLKICISNQFPGNADAAGLGTTVQGPLRQRNPLRENIKGKRDLDDIRTQSPEEEDHISFESSFSFNALHHFISRTLASLSQKQALSLIPESQELEQDLKFNRNSSN